MYQDRVQQHSYAQLGQTKVERKLRATALREAAAVFVVDREASMRQSLEAIIHSAGWEVQIFASVAAFLSWPRTLAPGCVILDIALPDSNGQELQERLNRHETGLSTIFIMEHPDITLAVRAMRAGAVDVLAKPIDDEALLSALEEAIGLSRAALDEHTSLTALREDYATLSKREREVMALIVSGLMNKQVGWELGISEITVKAHRGQVMRKMRARSFADLVNKAAHLGQEPH